MSSRSSSGRLSKMLLLAGVAACFACGASKGPEHPTPRHPAYSPEAARLFDDTFAPVVFGFDAEARDLARDPQLRERTRLANFIVPARVETVSRVGGVENRGAYEIILAPVAAPLVGSHSGGRLELTILPSNPSYAWLEGAGPDWVGTRVLAFGRYYTGANDSGADEPELHFRCEADTEEVRRIVARNAALRLLR